MEAVDAGHEAAAWNLSLALRSISSSPLLLRDRVSHSPEPWMPGAALPKKGAGRVPPEAGGPHTSIPRAGVSRTILHLCSPKSKETGVAPSNASLWFSFLIK